MDQNRKEKDVRWSDWLLAAGILAATSFWPCFFQFVINYKEARVPDMLLFTGLFLGTGALLFLLALVLYRRPLKAALLSEACLLLVINYGLLLSSARKLLPALRARWLLLILGVLLLALAIWLFRRKRNGRVICQLLAIFLGVLLGMTLIRYVPLQAARIMQFQRTAAGSKELPQPEQIPESRPNVYLFLFDEYGGPENLMHYYQIEDPIYPQLEALGFCCAKTSHNRESLSTMQLVPNLLELQLDAPESFVSGDGHVPLLYQLFRNMGYRVNLMNHVDFLDSDGTNDLTPSQRPDSICRFLYGNSVFPHSPLRTAMEKLPQLQDQKGIDYYRRHLSEVLDLFDRSAELTGTTPTLTVGYVQMPHVEYVFGPEGEPVENGNYPDQLHYTGTRMIHMVENIIRQDPEAIIFLQSDHGARVANSDWLWGGIPFDEETEVPYMQNILNCVYCQGRPMEIEGLSGINTVIAVLNETFGYDFSPVEAPQFYYHYDFDNPEGSSNPSGPHP